jgi:hypothetical protein
MPRLGISEILEKVSNESNPDHKVRILLENDSPVLRHILRLAFTPGVEWLLPEGTPPFQVNNLPGQQGNLYAEWRRFYLFFPGGNDNLKQMKRETIFVQILETLDPRDAVLICSIKDGKMPYKTVTANLVEKTWPGLIGG